MNKCLVLIVLLLVNLMASGQEKPNVIVIMADDLGYADVGFNGSTEIPTPNIDRIADNGIKFTSAYTTYSVCGPSRAGFITGRYQQRFGFERNPLYRVDDPYMGLPLDEMTIAESVSQVGYKTGIIGKWHLGAHISNHPLNRGFDEFYGHLGGGHRYFPEDLTIEDSYAATNEEESYLTWILRNHKPEKTDEYITDEFSNEAVNFVSRHKEHPFFLFLSYNAPHSPMQATDADLALFPSLTDKRKIYAAMVNAVDRGVGKVLDKLQELNIEENTIIFFLSDNGGPESKNASDNGILRGGKSDVFEGGYRVPFAMQWTGEIDGGVTYDYPVSSLDIFATLSALSDSPINLEKPLDGVNLIPYLVGENGKRPHETIHIRKFDQDRHAVRYGDMKYIRFMAESPNPRLYNLNTNISESDADGQNLYWNADYKPQRDELQAIQAEWEEGLLHPRFLGLVHDELVWATEVTLSRENIELNSNDTYQLEASILPNDAFNDVIEWNSNNPSVASVNESGMVTALSEGYAIVTARVVDRRQVFKQCVVKVGSPDEASTITLSDNVLTLTTGKPASLTAEVNSSSSYAIEWSSNNMAVATVNEHGQILTHHQGQAVITAWVIGSPNISAECEINVEDYQEDTGIFDNDLVQADFFSVYPNPLVNGQATILLKMNEPKVYMQLYDVSGQLVKEKALEGVRQYILNVSGLANGLYFINMNTDKMVQTKKILVRN
ncbi:sulfatase-like hydrolase/transferase [Carboxylicivirga mesophila]|uniref:Sulfatase-like hydrolase/transferase n=1 Tax=Carboxylicivirga mesophila TaxID=1166478 RepID=A0ABS5K8J4_9BACT|nr:sulfatase-like hydrolase/transferase [Carboxylicivirga mesophila]MBS2211310.1 sulfatase-like hydrolase/transferase [Carboxylicivirga mesophila]